MAAEDDGVTLRRRATRTLRRISGAVGDFTHKTIDLISSKPSGPEETEVDVDAVYASIQEVERVAAAPGRPEEPPRQKPQQPRPRRGFGRFNALLERWAVFRWIEEKTGIHKVYFAFWTIVLACALTIYYVGINAFSLGIAFVYPAYRSYKALEREDLQEHLHWLTYWVVFGVFDTIDGFLDWVLQWMPYYPILKLLFLFWLFLPRTKGCGLVYESIIRPLFQSHQDSIDQSLDFLTGKLSQISGEVAAMVTEILQAVLTAVVKGIAAAGAAQQQLRQQQQQQQGTGGKKLL